MRRRFFSASPAFLLLMLAGCASPPNDSIPAETAALAPRPTVAATPIPVIAPEPVVAPIPVATPTPFVKPRTKPVDVAPVSSQSLAEAFPVQETTPARRNTRRSGAENSRPQRPRSSTPRTQRVDPESNSVAQQGGQVWVNTNSDVYHMPGMRYYGKTREGYYATEAEAQAAGYRRATR